MKKVRDIMTRGPRCVSPDAMLTEAAKIMVEMDVGSLPICDHERLAGMITDRDIVVRAVAAGRDPGSTTVREAMSGSIVFITEDDDVEEVTRLFESKRIRRLPVLTREKRLVGIVSLGDLAVNAGAGPGGEALKEISVPTQSHTD